MLRPSWCVLASLAAFAASSVGARDLSVIKREGRLDVVTVGDSPFEADLLRGFARSIGAELHLDVVDSAQLALAAVSAGRADVAAGGLLASRDSAAIVFSEEVFPGRVVIVTRKPAPPLQFIEQLRTERLAAPPEAAQALAAAKVSRVEAARDAQAALERLRGGGASAVAMPLFDALRARARDPELQLGAYLGARQSVGFALRTADGELAKALNQHLTALRSSTSWRLLIGRHFANFGFEELVRAKLSEGS